MNAPNLGVPIQNKYVILPAQKVVTQKKGASIVEGINVRQLVSQQVDRCKLLGRS